MNDINKLRELIIKDLILNCNFFTDLQKKETECKDFKFQSGTKFELVLQKFKSGNDDINELTNEEKEIIKEHLINQENFKGLHSINTIYYTRILDQYIYFNIIDHKLEKLSYENKRPEIHLLKYFQLNTSYELIKEKYDCQICKKNQCNLIFTNNCKNLNRNNEINWCVCLTQDRKSKENFIIYECCKDCFIKHYKTEIFKIPYKISELIQNQNQHHNNTITDDLNCLISCPLCSGYLCPYSLQANDSLLNRESNKPNLGNMYKDFLKQDTDLEKNISPVQFQNLTNVSINLREFMETINLQMTTIHAELLHNRKLLLGYSYTHPQQEGIQQFNCNDHNEINPVRYAQQYVDPIYFNNESTNVQQEDPIEKLMNNHIIDEREFSGILNSNFESRVEINSEKIIQSKKPKKFQVKQEQRQRQRKRKRDAGCSHCSEKGHYIKTCEKYKKSKCGIETNDKVICDDNINEKIDEFNENDELEIDLSVFDKLLFL